MRSNHHAVIAAAGLMLGLWLTPAQASDLTVSAKSGQVTVIEGGHPVAATVGAKLTPPVEVHTGSDGAIDLQQLGSILHLGPNATIVLPEAADNAVDRIKQTTGSVLYNIKSRKDHPLSVETPYLVSVVKGTMFTVAVEGHAATVALMEGSLDISAPGVANHILLKPNQSIRHAEGEPQMLVLSSAPAAAIPRGGLRTDAQFALPPSAQSGQMAQVARDLADAGAAVSAGHAIATRASLTTTAATSSGVTSTSTGAPSSPGGSASTASNTSSGSTASNTSSGSSSSPTAGGSSGSSAGSSSSGTSPLVTLPSSGGDSSSNIGGNCNGKNNGTGNGNCYGHQPKQVLKQ